MTVVLKVVRTRRLFVLPGVHHLALAVDEVSEVLAELAEEHVTGDVPAWFRTRPRGISVAARIHRGGGPSPSAVPAASGVVSFAVSLPPQPNIPPRSKTKNGRLTTLMDRMVGIPSVGRARMIAKRAADVGADASGLPVQGSL